MRCKKANVASGARADDRALLIIGSASIIHVMICIALGATFIRASPLKSQPCRLPAAFVDLSHWAQHGLISSVSDGLGRQLVALFISTHQSNISTKEFWQLEKSIRGDFRLRAQHPEQAQRRIIGMLAPSQALIGPSRAARCSL